MEQYRKREVACAINCEERISYTKSVVVKSFSWRMRHTYLPTYKIAKLVNIGTELHHTVRCGKVVGDGEFMTTRLGRRYRSHTVVLSRDDRKVFG